MKLASETCRHKSIDELLGICRGIIADDHVCIKEAYFLQEWLIENGGKNNHILKGFTQKIDSILSDGYIDSHETRELIDLFKDMTNNNVFLPDVQTTENNITDDSVALTFKGKVFVFSGIFSAGSRDKIQKKVFELGGTIKDNVTHATDYLVVGNYANPDWSSLSMGNKIKYALDLKNRFNRINIISERKLTFEIYKTEQNSFVNFDFNSKEPRKINLSIFKKLLPTSDIHIFLIKKLILIAQWIVFSLTAFCFLGVAFIEPNGNHFLAGAIFILSILICPLWTKFLK